jgi:hypothetical protein
LLIFGQEGMEHLAIAGCYERSVFDACTEWEKTIEDDKNNHSAGGAA